MQTNLGRIDEAKAKAKSDDDEKEVMKALLNTATEALKGFKSTHKLKKADDKGETIISHLSENEAHSRELIAFNNKLKETK